MTDTQAIAKEENNEAIIFEFSDPEPINSWQDMLSVFYNSSSDYYMPPIDPKGLDKISRANATHRRCINFKVSQMAIIFVETGIMSLRDFRRCARDLETFGNFYAKTIKNRFGEILRLVHVPALNMRKMKGDRFKLLQKGSDEDIVFEKGEILQGFHYDTGQTIYGIPEWIGALHDIFLNSEATLFRRRYYKNGSHLGYILYSTDPNLDKETETMLREKIKQGKGAGNFKSMFINIPNGKEKAIQLIPVGDIAQKDEFERIKKISGDDILIGHGVQAGLSGMKPENIGGFGDLEKLEIFYRNNETRSHIQPFLELNEFLPKNKKFEFNFDINTSSK